MTYYDLYTLATAYAISACLIISFKSFKLWWNWRGATKDHDRYFKRTKTQG